MYTFFEKIGNDTHTSDVMALLSVPLALGVAGFVVAKCYLDYLQGENETRKNSKTELSALIRICESYQAVLSEGPEFIAALHARLDGEKLEVDSLRQLDVICNNVQQLSHDRFSLSTEQLDSLIQQYKDELHALLNEHEDFKQNLETLVQRQNEQLQRDDEQLIQLMQEREQLRLAL